MKYTSLIVFMALVAHTGGRSLSNRQLSQIQNRVSESSESESSSTDEPTHLQTEKILETVQGWSGVEPKMHKFPGTQNEMGNWVDPYMRNLPERFDGDEALDAYPVDKFTQNMIENYAVEGVDGLKVKNPVPNGRYFMRKSTLKQVAYEILATHFGLKGKEADAYLNDKFDYAFDYYDVNKDGRLDAIGMSAQFFRFLTKPLGEIDLQ